MIGVLHLKVSIPPPTSEEDPPADSGLYRDEKKIVRCLKCHSPSGDDYAQCEGQCPVKGSRYYSDGCFRAFEPEAPPETPEDCGGP